MCQEKYNRPCSSYLRSCFFVPLNYHSELDQAPTWPNFIKINIQDWYINGPPWKENIHIDRYSASALALIVCAEVRQKKNLSSGLIPRNIFIFLGQNMKPIQSEVLSDVSFSLQCWKVVWENWGLGQQRTEPYMEPDNI